MRLILCDLYPPLVAAWRQEFAGCDDVEIREGDLLEVPADAYASPANSFGAMDGGIDFDLRERFGYEIEDRVRDSIQDRGGMLPVGQALVVETGDVEVTYLISAPTMEVPTFVASTANAYHAMRALLLAALRFNERQPGAIATIAIPGLCTGTGGMAPETAARQMRSAYDAVKRLAKDR
jgi:O-acetyl-ADP-ribose deacetylase (regulator of RNase III)